MKNVIENKKEKTFTVQLPGGKTKIYKTLKGADNCANKNSTSLDIPRVVTANTYFWNSGGNASSRRSNESRYQNEIDCFATKVMKLVPGVKISGFFSQSCNNTYKKMSYSVTRKERLVETNLTGLIGYCLQWGVELRK